MLHPDVIRSKENLRDCESLVVHVKNLVGSSKHFVGLLDAPLPVGGKVWEDIFSYDGISLGIGPIRESMAARGK